MIYTPRRNRDAESLFDSLEPVARGMGMAILELSHIRRKGRGGEPGTVQVRVTIYKNGSIGVEDCSRFHRAVLPRLELAFPGSELDVEVSSPGIGRLIKDGSEMVHFIGRGVRCYCVDAQTDGSGWVSGTLVSADGKGIVLDTGKERIVLPYEKIAKAKLDEALQGFKC